jgi:hypothetical protein
MPIVYEIFPDEYIQLNRELSSGLHPKLEKLFEELNLSPNEIDLRIMHIAAYCGLEVDGTYTLIQRMAICNLLTDMLKDKREMRPAIIIN